MADSQWRLLVKRPWEVIECSNDPNEKLNWSDTTTAYNRGKMIDPQYRRLLNLRLVHSFRDSGVRRETIIIDRLFYRRLARLELSRKSIQEFASQYGPLIHSEDVPEDMGYLMDWAFAIKTLAHGVELWDDIKGKSWAAGAMIRAFMPNNAGSKGVLNVSPIPGLGILAINPICFAREAFESGGLLIDIARAYVDGLANQQLAGRGPSPRIERTPDKGARVSMIFSRFIDLAWAQFVEDIASDTNYEGCENCGNVYVLSPKHTRQDRRTCSGACRSALARARKNMAVRLARDGVSLETLVALTDARPETIQRWIAQEKNKNAKS